MRSSQLPLHEIDRNTGERIHHLNVTESGQEVANKDIIKGFETDDDKTVLIEPEEIDNIKLPSNNLLDLVTFVDIAAIPIERYERPYFILPSGRNAGEIYAVINQALEKSQKAGIGQIAMHGREELCAVLSAKDGLMLETLRYDRELADSHDFFPTLKHTRTKDDYVELANQLIEKNSSTPNFSKFRDHYHEALLDLIMAKRAHRKPRRHKSDQTPAKVIDFADALRKSLATKNRRSHTSPTKHG